MVKCSNKCIYEPGCKGAWQEDCSGPVFAEPVKVKVSDEKPQPATAITTAEYDKLKRKADLWDQYAIYDNDNEPEILVKDLIIAHEKLEAFKKLFKKGPSLNVDTLEECHQAIDDWLGKMMNLLEAKK